jgi:23S rRNA (cytidine2498-2'-O)-methyltransferase
MMKRIETAFLFALTNPGSEKALKQEVETMSLSWRSSYQRRGFVSFKSDTPLSLESLDAEVACVRRLCLSLGKFASRDEALTQLKDVSVIHEAKYFDRKMQGLSQDTLAVRPADGALIGTLVELGENEFWAGVHRQRGFLSPDPAGDAGIVMATKSPSRAWLKLEEATRFFDLKFTAADIVVELGCAPGGVVLALLDRGVSVIGVDPAKMAAVVMEFAIPHREDAKPGKPWFYHCRKPAALTSKRDLGQGVTWFMSDMNQSPEVVLKECARFCKMAPSIRGVLVTLKLTDPVQVVEKSAWFTALRDMGFHTIRLQQLAVHHKELALLALR